MIRLPVSFAPCETRANDYAGTMRTTLIWIAVLIVVLIGGYFLYQLFMTGPEADNTGQPAAAAGAATTTPDQVQAQEVTVGTGAEAVPGTKVSVLYIGQLPDGTVFDSSEAHGNTPLEFILGEPGMIAGFQIGVNGMKVGGERLIAIPPSLGYGTQAVTDASGAIIIPANSTIVFDVKLVKVEPAAATSGGGTQ